MHWYFPSKKVWAARILIFLSCFSCIVLYLKHIEVFNPVNIAKLHSDTTHPQIIEEYIWNRKTNLHSEFDAERQLLLADINWDEIEALNAYDMFELEWNCEDETRFGNGVVSIGDGPKFACGSTVLASTDNCIVYSIGSNYDFSFEYAVNRIAPLCEIHTFDGTMDLSERPLPEDLSGKRIHFHNWNVIADCTDSGASALCVTDTLRKLGHSLKTVTWLKIDCEGCEYSVIPSFFQSRLQIDQIMVEIHGYDPKRIADLFGIFRDEGLMIFHKERNHWGCNGYTCVEYSLINSKYARKALHNYLSVRN
jgi:hypothetical protein